MVLERLAWLEVDLSKIRHNLKQVQNHVGEKTKIMAVVKANAYGHGSVEVSKAAIDAGAAALGVASFVEAKQLREAGIKTPVVILGFTPAENYLDMINYSLTVTVRSLDVARALSTAARRAGKQTKIWIKVNTGMNRLGLNPGEVLFFIKKAQGLPNLVVEGLFTHFADADNLDLEFAKKQLSSFDKLLEELKRDKVAVPIVSAANSAASVKVPDSSFDMVRIGIAMYGLKPGKDFNYGLDIRPALSFKTQITQMTEIASGDSVGYGREFIARKPTLVATLAVGYGDGFRRSPKNWGEVLINGQRAPLIGRVSMDQAAVDITDLKGNIRRGEEVVLIGESGNESLTAEDVAENLGTISYEVATAIASRVPRLYKES